MSVLVFDLDDTLYLERDYALSGFRAVARRFSGLLGDPSRVAAIMQDKFDSPDRRRVFDATLAELGRPADPDLVSRMVSTYRAHRPEISLCPDAARALDRFASTHRLALITDGPANQQRQKIESLRLLSRFEVIVLTDLLGEGLSKPHARAFELVMSKLHAGPRDCTYVADNRRKDFVAPNALGWKTVCVGRAGGLYAHEAAPPGGSPGRTIATLDELEA